MRKQRDHLLALMKKLLKLFVPRSEINSLSLEELYELHPQHIIGLQTISALQDQEEEVDV